MDRVLKEKMQIEVKQVLTFAGNGHGQHAFTSQEAAAITDAIVKAFEIYEKSKK